MTSAAHRPRPLRRPPEHKPLQHRQLGIHPLKLGIAAHKLPPQPGVLRPQLRGSPLPALIRLQRTRQLECPEASGQSIQ